MLTTAPMHGDSSGVRVSCSPRSTPVVASTASIAGIPSSDQRRKVMPKSETVRVAAEPVDQLPAPAASRPAGPRRPMITAR